MRRPPVLLDHHTPSAGLQQSRPGRPSLASLQEELTNLELCRRRVAVEAPHELRRHPAPARITWLAAFVYLRARSLTDDLVDLLIDTVHRIGARAQRKVERELLDEPQARHRKAQSPVRTCRRGAGQARRCGTLFMPVRAARRSAISALFIDSPPRHRDAALLSAAGASPSSCKALSQIATGRDARRISVCCPLIAAPRSVCTAAALVFSTRAAWAGLVAAHLAAECQRIVMDGWGMEPGAAPAALPDLPGLGPGVQIAHELRDHSGAQAGRARPRSLPSTPSGRNRNRSAQRSC